MKAALEEAGKAHDEQEVPVGAVLVYAGKIIARGHNRSIMLSDPTAHAEMIALTAAAESVGNWRLGGCTMYVTLEPCSMCAGALVLARIDRLVYGCDDPKTGACGSLYNIVQDERLNHRIEISSGVLLDECREQLQGFFRRRRSENPGDE